MDNIITGDIFTVVSDLRTERDTLKAENERLKAQLAETWQPVEDGSEFSMGGARTLSTHLHEEGWWFLLLKNEIDTDQVLSFLLPNNLRLCRKAVTVAAEPVVVDWEKHKEGYRWFAVDADGSGWVYWCLPSEGKIDAWMGTGRRIGYFNLNGIDWRATLTERPNQPSSGVTKA